MPRASNFSNETRARIFVRDRAHCCYCGAPLWLLDEGAAWQTIDWVDHVRPSSSGGAATLKNGRCACAECNMEKGIGRATAMVLLNGKPTPTLQLVNPELRRFLRSNVQRFQHLHTSDWYLNRAAWHVLLGVHWLTEQRFKRYDEYRARGALRLLGEWRRKSRGVANLEERKLVPSRPAVHHVLLLSIREAETKEALLKLMKQLLSAYEEHQRYYTGVNNAYLETPSCAAYKQFVMKRRDKHATPGNVHWRIEMLYGKRGRLCIRDVALAEIVGDKPLYGPELWKRIFAYMDKHGLQDGENVHTDEKLRKVCRGKRVVTLYELQSYVLPRILGLRDQGSE